MNSNELVIQEMTSEADLVDVVQLLAGFASSAAEFDSAAVKARLKDNRFSYTQLIARLNGEAIGTVGVRPSFDPMDQDLWFEISNLIVSPDHRKSGLGSEILAAAEKYCKDKGAGMVRLGVMKDEDGLKNYYLKRQYSEKAKLLCKSLSK